MKRRKPGCLTRLLRLLILATALGAFLWFENETIQTDAITITSRRIPAAFDGFRIVELADIHGEIFGPDNSCLIEKTAQAQPDIITLNGDLIDDEAQLETLPSLLEGLVDIAPVFYVSGNHEWACGCANELFGLLEDCGVTVLRNEYRVLTIGEDEIILAGIDDPNGPYDMKTPAQLMDEISAAQKDAYTIMLAHRNDSLDMWTQLETDVVLCGHGHGGVIRIPFVGGLIGVDRSLFPQYTAGLYTSGSTNMVVSRGLGNSVVDFRLFNRPEVLVIQLCRQ